MNWLYESTGQPPVVFFEPKINCDRCEVTKPLQRASSYNSQSKCCDFRPFWSGFAAGSFLENRSLLPMLNDSGAVLTKLGVMQSLKRRRDSQSLCQYYRGGGGCGIWQQRPATCYSFFCTSQYNKGPKLYSLVERLHLSFEAQMLKLWFDHHIGDSHLWSNWCEYMEEAPDIEQLPEELLLKDMNEAESHYKEMAAWLRKSLQS